MVDAVPTTEPSSNTTTPEPAPTTPIRPEPSPTKEDAVTTPEIFALPVTERVLDGFVVPIPTLESV